MYAGNFGIFVAADCQCPRQVVLGLPKIRIKPHGILKMRYGRVQPAPADHDNAQVVVGFRQVRLDGQSPVEMLERLVDTALAQQLTAQVVVGFSVVRI